MILIVIAAVAILWMILRARRKAIPTAAVNTNAELDATASSDSVGIDVESSGYDVADSIVARRTGLVGSRTSKMRRSSNPRT